MPSKSAFAQKSAHKALDRLFHYEVDQAAQAIQGFPLGRSGPASQSLTPLWNVDLSAGGESIVAIAEPAHREWDHVPVHIKGDASILYKYINANLLAVATEETSNDSTSLNLYVLDAVTG